MDVEKELLIKIEEIIKTYNHLNPNDKLTLKKENQMHDIRNISICTYNEGSIGLFKEEKIKYLNSLYTIYTGISPNYLGVKITFPKQNVEWKTIGDEITIKENNYLVSCNMHSAISFDEMRFIMYQIGKIAPYEIGVATSREMLEVLSFAASYYQILPNQNKQEHQR